jgi:hypothetical protein
MECSERVNGNVPVHEDYRAEPLSSSTAKRASASAISSRRPASVRGSFAKRRMVRIREIWWRSKTHHLRFLWARCIVPIAETCGCWRALEPLQCIRCPHRTLPQSAVGGSLARCISALREMRYLGGPCRAMRQARHGPNLQHEPLHAAGCETR